MPASCCRPAAGPQGFLWPAFDPGMAKGAPRSLGAPFLLSPITQSRSPSAFLIISRLIVNLSRLCFTAHLATVMARRPGREQRTQGLRGDGLTKSLFFANSAEGRPPVRRGTRGSKVPAPGKGTLFRAGVSPGAIVGAGWGSILWDVCHTNEPRLPNLISRDDIGYFRQPSGAWLIVPAAAGDRVDHTDGGDKKAPENQRFSGACHCARRGT